MDEIRKNDFIGMVSHELKTPLTSLGGYIQVIQRRAQQTNDKFIIGALSTASRQVKQMTDMINGFLNISRLESGKIVLEKSRFDLHDLIADTVADSLQLDSKHQISYEGCGSIKVVADKNKIGNVISNFLSNAIKYSSTGAIVNVKCEGIAASVQVSVSDQGRGLKPADLERNLNVITAWMIVAIFRGSE